MARVRARRIARAHGVPAARIDVRPHEHAPTSVAEGCGGGQDPSGFKGKRLVSLPHVGYHSEVDFCEERCHSEAEGTDASGTVSSSASAAASASRPGERAACTPWSVRREEWRAV